LILDSLSIMQATDCNYNCKCMEVGLWVVGFPQSVADVMEVVELLQLSVVVQIFGEAEKRCQL